MPLILAIESSCDETAVAILRGEPGRPAEVLASEIASQIDLHRAYGGVVPELASRNHSLHLRPLIERALETAGVGIREIDVFGATSGPGLASSLLIGSTAAKALAAATGKPFVAVNHLEGHLLSPFVDRGEIPPHLALVVSGGHTLLLDVAGAGHYRRIGSTRDDAAGEAFDKVAKMLGLPYPGGPEIEQTAAAGNPTAFDFPRSMLKEANFDFSFSGLKTAVLYTLTDRDPDHGTPQPADLPDLCASFQQAVVDVLLAKTLRAAADLGRETVALSGGVSLNAVLRNAFREGCQSSGRQLILAKPQLCTDNAAMIGFAGLHHHFKGHHAPLDTGIDPNLPLALG
ncbi:tRNA (adenosine(37)-N6)-threonylcarbamoyltransferase complex transferase subunit TsaD [Haloferula sp. A504]|uniref:tRNA (adenosine(37)-N6)-threonylcarbamoyltransferase complex transferase subunit TsaD n=1 Tax=Haloferula sp. A504 TaxID=3373601 RepID=UPI0031C847B5|nr:tRNA (adenosine(37)-N6)-threonylcarbamoyltransferase complex transferase subunit TsaD [Verrucomicrobiaceae bacterium E54]